MIRATPNEWRILVGIMLLGTFFLGASWDMNSVRANGMLIWNQANIQYPQNTGYETLPDTFANHIILHANNTINVCITSFSKFGCIYQTSGKNIDFWFNESEGCGGYYMMITANVPTLIQPDYVGYYRSSPIPTGDCK